MAGLYLFVIISFALILEFMEVIYNEREILMPIFAEALVF